MATKDALRYLYVTLTQGSADAFVQASMATALSGATKTAYRMRELLIETTGGNVMNGGYEIALARKSLTAMPTVVDKSVIFARKWANIMTTSGAIYVPRTYREPFGEDDNILIVEDPVYWQLDSNATSVANVFYVRLGYEVVTISEVDRLTLVANSLA